MTEQKHLESEPVHLRAYITVEGNRIVIDRSEFPLSQYPGISNLELLETVAANERRAMESGKKSPLEAI